MKAWKKAGGDMEFAREVQRRVRELAPKSSHLERLAELMGPAKK